MPDLNFAGFNFDELTAYNLLRIHHDYVVRRDHILDCEIARQPLDEARYDQLREQQNEIVNASWAAYEQFSKAMDRRLIELSERYRNYPSYLR